MKIVIINKSDMTGGAAVVSFRLMQALRSAGADARMLVVEKLSDSPYVELAGSPATIRKSFIAERLKIFMANGLDRSTLFKIDTASDGLPLWKHPLVEEADAVLLNWVNQGMLSLSGVEKLLSLGKPVVWTMHDMWCMTGICHHAGTCGEYREECRKCTLLSKKSLRPDLAYATWRRKRSLYSLPHKIKFVAVSRWLKERSSISSLLHRQEVTVIPNAFLLPVSLQVRTGNTKDDIIRIGFGAARLDDPIKGFPVLLEMTKVLKDRYPELAKRVEVVTFGNIKDATLLEGFAVPHRHLGMVKGEGEIKKVIENTDIIVSSSSYETLPGTLVEAQAYGAVPVSFDRGGQRDIIDHLSTGYLAEYADDRKIAATRLAEGVAWAAGKTDNPSEIVGIRKKMLDGVRQKFSPEAVAKSYLSLISSSVTSPEV